MGVVAAAAMAADRRLVQSLTDRRATTPGNAVHIDVSRALERRRLEGLERRGIVHRLADDRYWLDTEAWDARQARMHRMARFMLVLALAIFAVLIVIVMRKP